MQDPGPEVHKAGPPGKRSGLGPQGQQRHVRQPHSRPFPPALRRARGDPVPRSAGEPRLLHDRQREAHVSRLVSRELYFFFP